MNQDQGNCVATDLGLQEFAVVGGRSADLRSGPATGSAPRRTAAVRGAAYTPGTRAARPAARPPPPSPRHVGARWRRSTAGRSSWRWRIAPQRLRVCAGSGVDGVLIPLASRFCSAFPCRHRKDVDFAACTVRLDPGTTKNDDGGRSRSRRTRWCGSCSSRSAPTSRRSSAGTER